MKKSSLNNAGDDVGMHTFEFKKKKLEASSWSARAEAHKKTLHYAEKTLHHKVDGTLA